VAAGRRATGPTGGRAVGAAAAAVCGALALTASPAAPAHPDAEGEQAMARAVLAVVEKRGRVGR
jgi:lysophospholipase L1-like esterase